MTTFIQSDEDSSAEQIFKKKIKYAVTLNKTKASNLINFNFGEKLFYGRMNYHQAPIALNRKESSLVPLTYVDDVGSTLHAVNFVAEAFNQMAAQFRRSIAEGKIRSDTSYLSNLTAYKAFEDPFTKYREYKKSYFEKILKKFKRKKIKFLNMDEFLSALVRETQYALPMAPLTFPGFIKSKFNSALSSGLAIEIADLSYSNDQQKITSFVGSANWKYFVQTCSTYGFMIDKNIPWRIVADISRGAMKLRQSAYPIGGTAWLLNTTYVAAALPYLGFFVDDLLELYNLTRAQRIQVPSFCDGRTVTRVLTPATYTPQEAHRYFTLEKIMIVYCTLRLNESKPNLSDGAKK